MKEKSMHQWELEIKRMVEKRTGEFDVWLRPQLRATAMNCVLLDKVQGELRGGILKFQFFRWDIISYRDNRMRGYMVNANL